MIPGPQTRVVEIRIPGIMGVTAEDLTDAVAAVDVAGDTSGRIVRPADRLRRPAPGPMLHASGRPVPRIVEGYLWSGLTSGGWAKATWALLFPFTLANVTHWMLPPVPAGSWIARALSLVLRALLRLAAILLTMMFVGQFTVITLDLVAAQCLAPGTGCLAAVPEGWRQLPLLRPLVGLLPVAVTIYGLHRVSTVDWQVATATPATEPDDTQRPGAPLPGDHLDADPDTPALRALHTLAALSCVGLLALGGPTGPARPGLLPVWSAAAALLGVAILGTVLLDDPTGRRRRPGPLRSLLRPAGRHVLGWLGAALLVATAIEIDPMPLIGEPLIGANTTLEVTGVVLALVCAAVAVLLIPAAVLARGDWKRLPIRLRPWAGGWLAAPVLVLASLLGTGFGAGLAITARTLLRAPGLRLPIGYDAVTMLWGLGATLGAALVVAALPIALLVRSVAGRCGRLAPEIALLHDGHDADARRAAPAWWRAGFERAHAQHAVLAAAVLLSAGALVSAALRVQRLTPPPWLHVVGGFGVAALAALAAGLLRTVYLAARRPDAARRLGILTDIASFWPRQAHPIVPPCYALKVIPEVVARTVGHLADRNTRVVISGHSQGSLLAAVAVSRVLRELPEADLDRVGLVTAGSQLQWAYPRAFPAVTPHPALRRLSGLLDGRWRALCRGTDPLGGPVCTWDRQVFGDQLLGVGYRSDGTDGPLPPATRTESGALVLGADHLLPDPAPGPVPGRRWHAGLLGHADYTFDPEWDHAVAIAAGLEPPPGPGDGHEPTGATRILGDSPALRRRPTHQV